MKHLTQKGLAVLAMTAGGVAVGEAAAQNIPPQEEYRGVIGDTYKESKQWFPEPPAAPEGAPNVIWILLDDVGYGASSAFGGLVHTPVMERLANGGLRYTNFHTTGISAPTRASLLTGRNHHDVHMGSFPQRSSALGFPGYDGIIPPKKGFASEILKDNGYSTFCVGKWGVLPDTEESFAGPFDRWPTGRGFEYFYGFLGNKTDQYAPDLMENHEPVEPDGRHLNAQLTDKAIEYIRRQHEAAPDKPFFLYFAPGATHSPHQVDTVWSNKYRGKFDEGWDVYREKVFRNQKRLGVIPADAKLPERNEIVQEWDALSEEEKKLFARYMEVYAGFLEYTDYEIGRLVDYLQQTGQLDNTVIFLMVGDNGGSKEGTLFGTSVPSDDPLATSESTASAVLGSITDPEGGRSKPTDAERLQYNLSRMDEIGRPTSFDNYPVGWAQAMNTPFRMWKQDANAEGAVHNPLIVYYPGRIKDAGGIRNQYLHVTDILPTTLEIVGVPQPEYIRNIPQDPIQGVSFLDSFDDADAPSHHNVQYYYLYGARAIYKDGWKASATHYPDNSMAIRLPSVSRQLLPDFDTDKWSLYNLEEDFTEVNDLSERYPEKLEELKAVFEQEARKNNVYPLIDWLDILKSNIHDALERKQRSEE